MKNERNTKDTQQEDNKKEVSSSSNQQHPINPFKEPARDDAETPEEESQAEQQRKEAMTERD